MLHIINKIRNKISVWISLKLLPENFSIISDDCWGGQIYRQLHIPYLTPTVGLWINPQNYIDYIENIKDIQKEKLIFIESEYDFPVAKISDVELYFMHYHNESEAEKKYKERYSRINLDKILYKIDFGKPGYKKYDILRWNKLQIPNSVAFYSKTIKIPKEGVHNGVLIDDWELDGARMFDISRRYFNVFSWIRDGKIIDNSLMYRMLNIILFDPTFPVRLINKLKKATWRVSS